MHSVYGDVHSIFGTEVRPGCSRYIVLVVVRAESNRKRIEEIALSEGAGADPPLSVRLHASVRSLSRAYSRCSLKPIRSQS